MNDIKIFNGTVSYQDIKAILWNDLSKFHQNLVHSRVIRNNIPCVVLLMQKKNSEWCNLKMFNDIPKEEFTLCLNDHVSIVYKIDDTIDLQFIFRLLDPASDEMICKCPLCDSQFIISRFESEISSDMFQKLSIHMCKHLEVRMCIDCSSFLPNSCANMSLNSDVNEFHVHKCSDVCTENKYSSNQLELNDKKQPEFRCLDCNTTYCSKGNLTKHFDQVHNVNKAKTCNICFQTLSNKYSLIRHLSSKHDIVSGTKDDFKPVSIFSAEKEKVVDKPPESGKSYRIFYHPRKV